MVKKFNEFKDLQKKKGKKGFSMIELIIVIAIMAILVALIGTQLVPYLEKSRENRDKTTLDTCKTAFESVVADDEMTMPDGTYTTNDLTGTNGVTAFYEYAGLKAGDKPFKSKKSQSASGNDSSVDDVTFKYEDGVLTEVSVGSLTVTNGVS